MASEVRFTDAEINSVMKTIRGLTENQTKGLEILRRDICDHIKACDTNITVVIYIDALLPEPLEATVGKGENRLLVTVHVDGEVTYKWAHETWGKFFADLMRKAGDVVKKILLGIKKIFVHTDEIEGLETNALCNTIPS